MLSAIKWNSFFLFCSHTQCYSRIRVKVFRGKTSTPRGQERLGQPPPRNAKRARLAAFDKIGNMFSLTYSQIIAQQFRQLKEYCRQLFFMKTSHEINCCVFKSRERMSAMVGASYRTLAARLLACRWTTLHCVLSTMPAC